MQRWPHPGKGNETQEQKLGPTSAEESGASRTAAITLDSRKVSWASSSWRGHGNGEEEETSTTSPSKKEKKWRPHSAVKEAEKKHRFERLKKIGSCRHGPLGLSV